MKRCDAVDRSRSVVEEVAATVAVLFLDEAEGSGCEMEWASAGAKELLVGLGLVGLGLVGEVVVVVVLPWVLCSLDSR